MSRDELQGQSLQAALGDVAIARVEFDDVAGWLAAAGASPVDPLAAEVWVFDPDLTQVLLVLHPWRGWVPPGGKVETGETPREAALRELFEETGLEAELLARPAAVTVRSYHPDHGETLGLSYAAIVDPAAALVAEPGQPVAWMNLDHQWESCFPDDPSRIRRHAQWLRGQGRPEPPLASGETETLIGFLEYQRATFAWKCSGLDAAGLTATVGASTMTLGGMLKHLAYYEDHWFSHRMRGNERHTVWNDDYWNADPDWEWNSAAEDSPDELHTLWQDAVSRSRDLLSETLADGGLEQLARRSLPDGRTPSVRWIVVHMIEEYARHNGHADLIRESVDGLVGE